MALSADRNLRAHLENNLLSNVSAYVENKLKRFGLYRRTTIHNGTSVAQKTFGDRIKCIDTLLRESGKFLVSKLPITALSREETYEMHLKDILKAEWSAYGILVVDDGGQRHKDYYISAFLSVADVRTSVQKIYHKSRLELYEELQNTIKIMPSVNGRRLSCSRNDSEELYRLRSFADHMSQIKDLFRLQSGLDIRSFQKNEDGPYRYDPKYSGRDIRYEVSTVPYGPWENLVQSLHFLVSDEASCMMMVNQYYSSSDGKFEFLVSYLNKNESRGKFISDIYHHPVMAVLELLRVSGPDINLLGDGNTQGGGSLCPIDFFFGAVGVNLIATITFFLQKMVLFGGSIIGETTLKDFFYPESGVYHFKPGEGLERCTRYVTEDLKMAFPSVTEEDGDSKFSIVSRRRFQIIALLSKFFLATRGSILETQLQPHEKDPKLRGSSIDFDFESVSTSNFNEGNGQLIAAFENTSQSSSSSVTHSGMIHLPRGATSIPIVDGHLALHGIPSRQSFTGRSDISSADGESMGTLDGNSSSSSTSIKSKSSSLWDIQSDESRAGSDNTSHSASTGDNSNSSQIAIGKDSSSSSSSSRSKKKYIPDKKDDMYSAGDITQNKRPRGTVGPSFSIDETSNSINISSSSSSDPRISSVKSPARLGQIAIAVVLASIRDSGPSIPTAIIRSRAIDAAVTDSGSHANDESSEHDLDPNISCEPFSDNRLDKNSTNSNNNININDNIINNNINDNIINNNINNNIINNNINNNNIINNNININDNIINNSINDNIINNNININDNIINNNNNSSNIISSNKRNINNQNNSTWYNVFSNYPISPPQEGKSVDDTSPPVLPL